MTPYVHILLPSYICFVVKMAPLVLAAAGGKCLREQWIFYTVRRRRKQFCFLGGSKWTNIYTFFTQPQTENPCFFFFGGGGSKWCHIYIHIFYTSCRRRKHSGFLVVKMVPYKHNFWFFWGLKCSHIYTFFTQLAVDEKLWVYFGASKCCHIYTFFTQLASGQKNRVFFGGGQNAAIYTHFGFFLGWKCCHIYIYTF